MLHRINIKLWQSCLLITVSAVFFLIGARFWNYAVNFEAYDDHFRLWTLEFAGFSIYGGILGAMFFLISYSKLIHRSVFELLDALVLPAGLAFAIARIGCFLNGCCSGKVTHSFLGVYFPQKSGLSSILGISIPLIGSTRLPVYPTQLFEMSLALIGLIVPLWLYLHKRSPAGVCFLIYFIWACAMRLLILPFRELTYPPLVVNVIYPLIYSILITFATLLLIFRLKKKRPLKSKTPTFKSESSSSKHQSA